MIHRFTGTIAVSAGSTPALPRAQEVLLLLFGHATRLSQEVAALSLPRTLILKVAPAPSLVPTRRRATNPALRGILSGDLELIAAVRAALGSQSPVALIATEYAKRAPPFSKRSRKHVAAVLTRTANNRTAIAKFFRAQRRLDFSPTPRAAVRVFLHPGGLERNAAPDTRLIFDGFFFGHALGS